MTRKEITALAQCIVNQKNRNEPFTNQQIVRLGEFCAFQNPKFSWEKWYEATKEAYKK